MTTLISRKQAKKDGLKFYDSTSPCPRGHTGKRYTNSCNCVQCMVNSEPKAYEIRAAKRRKATKRKVTLWAVPVAVISQVNIPQI